MAAINKMEAAVGKARKSADFPPSYWGDFFISLPMAPSSSMSESSVAELKEQVREMLRHVNDPMREMVLIDTIQRLGLKYHFEHEIDASLKILNDTCFDYDLHLFSLHFRLLRQGGYSIPSNGFNKFKDNTGKFKESLKFDAKGLLSLYEAAHMGTQGDEILDEAIDFTRGHLKFLKNNVSPSLAMDISRALEMPLRKGMERIQARQYISIYEKDEARDDILLKLAKLDYNQMQKLHQEELRKISMWWKELGLVKKLSYARDRVVECYFWAMAVYHEPHYGRARTIYTKVLKLISLMDDTYDVYGTLDELVPFHETIQRWDLGGIEQLPDYMKDYILALTDTFKIIEEELALEGNSYHVDYLKKAFTTLSKSYLDEVIWGSKKYMPTFKEYLKVAVKSCGFPAATCLSFVGMGDVVTKEVFDWVLTIPPMVYNASLVCRLHDDLNPNELEQMEAHSPTAIRCYMKDNGVSEEEARLKIGKMVVDAWKAINEEMVINASPIPIEVRKRALNLACSIEVIFRNADSYNYPAGEMKDNVAMLVVDPVPI
ncbi:putative terpene synthase 2 [Acorus calamus]|uniref:Terpene synthase 2 n=1 Tax=Acorus calamus TaxID=4465 RepID=A0AAV9CK54_ACOCL|nr:putative terpene synthase 2 [Acorus calamus]